MVSRVVHHMHDVFEVWKIAFEPLAYNQRFALDLRGGQTFDVLRKLLRLCYKRIKCRFEISIEILAAVMAARIENGEPVTLRFKNVDERQPNS
ncbi:hypothetical protein D3C87_1933110 [compost metagenome]